MSTAPRFVSLPDIAAALDLPVNRVHELIRERRLLAVRRDGTRQVPADFVQDGSVVKSLPATITLLTDAGYSDDEVIDWLCTADESLPGRPIDALRENRGSEVKRRAQALAL